MLCTTKLPSPYQGGQPATGKGRRRALGRLLGTVAMISLAIVPTAAVAGASPRLAPEQVLSTPPLCDKVSNSAVSGVLGYKVTLFFGISKSGVSNKSVGATANVTICSYAAGETTADLTKDVILFYMTVCKSPLSASGKCVPDKVTLADVKRVIASTDAADHYSVTAVKTYSGLGVPGIYASGAGTNLTFEEVAGFGGNSGNKVAAGLVAQADPKSEVAALAKLAIKAYF